MCVHINPCLFKKSKEEFFVLPAVPSFSTRRGRQSHGIFKTYPSIFSLRLIDQICSSLMRYIIQILN